MAADSATANLRAWACACAFALSSATPGPSRRSNTCLSRHKNKRKWLVPQSPAMKVAPVFIGCVVCLENENKERSDEARRDRHRDHGGVLRLCVGDWLRLEALCPHQCGLLPVRAIHPRVG